MSSWKLPFGRPLILSGEVVVVRLIAQAKGLEDDQVLWEIAQRDSYRLREKVAAAVHEHMGPEFDVRSMSFARGSLELLVVIGTLYYAVSRYKNFVESIELMVAQLRSVLAAFFDQRLPAPVVVQGSWTQGPGLLQAAPRFPGGISWERAGLVVWYLVLSHAAMLAVLLWLLIQGSRP